MNFKERVLYLAEATEDLSNLSAYQICMAGKEQKNFDFKKGLDALIKKDGIGYYVYIAGRDWKEFDYDKGLVGLIKKNEGDYYIYRAGNDWKKFDYKKALKFLRKKSTIHHYRKALKHWPKNLEQSLERSKKIKNKAKQVPKGRKYEL